MKYLLPALALVFGILVAWRVQVPAVPLPRAYVGVAALAGLDTLLGGVRAVFEARFKSDLFITGFIFNILLGMGLVYLGTKLGIEIYLAAVVALGGRIFANLSIIRRHYLTRWSDAKERRSMEVSQL
jgi:small basic protein